MKVANTEDDLKAILIEARKLAIMWKHGLISSEHLFFAMLKKECLASAYLLYFESKIWEERIKLLYPANGREKIHDPVPLTKEAERVMLHSFIIAKTNNKVSINTIDLLLAIMSYENDITKTLKETGIVIEDITTSQFKKPVKRFPPIVKPVRRKLYNKIETFIIFFGWKKKKIAALYQNAIDLYLYKQFGDSIKICEIGLGVSPKNVDFKRILAYSHLAMRNFENSLSYLNELVNEKPGDANFRLGLSFVHEAMGNYQEADDILIKLLLQQPENDAFLNSRGFSLFKQGRYSESIPFFEKAIQHNPLFAEPLNNLGFVKYQLGETDIAIPLIDRSLELDKGNSFACRNKGIIFLEQGNKTEALRNFNLAIKFGYTEEYGDEVAQLIQKCD